MDEQALMNLFNEYKPKQARIARLRGRSKGFGFVELETQELQQKAAEALDGKDHSGRTLNVKVAVVDLSAPAENPQDQQQQNTQQNNQQQNA
jgi:RNA recognition motif-containing protein